MKRLVPQDVEQEFRSNLEAEAVKLEARLLDYFKGKKDEKPNVDSGTTMDQPVKLAWQKFSKLTEARSRFAKISCIYVQADSQGCPIRIGKASEGLEARYRGGTGYAIDAAMHGSSNLVFVAAVDKDLCECIESELIWQGRRGLTYNNHGKITPPRRRVPVSHSGTSTIWNEFETA